MRKDVEQPLYMAQNFNQWVKGKCNTLDRANMLSQVLFEQNYDGLFTYQRRYVVGQLAKNRYVLED